MAFKSGDYLVICDICGFQRYASECRLNWRNFFVCAETCFEPRHEQYTEPKSLHEKQTVPIHRPPGDDVFIDTSIRPEEVEL